METLDATKTRKHKPNIHSEYLHAALNLNTPLGKDAIKKFVKLLNQYSFDAIAFQGMSGALLAPILAMKCKKTLIMVRKPKMYMSDGTATSHSAYAVEGDENAQRYIIIDDFISSGKTIQNVVRRISEFNPQAICIGALLYYDTLKYGGTPSVQNMRRHFSSDTLLNVASDVTDYWITNVEQGK